MASIVIMPKQGLMMEEGTITNWLVKEGGTVPAGSPLFEMETDKLTITIYAVGKIVKTPVVVTNDEGEDEIVIKPMCALCLSYDHRVIDGAEAAKFLQKLKNYLQNPVLLI